MAGKNVGMTLLGVMVAIGAFVASNIWAQSLHEKVDRITNATSEWVAAYNARTTRRSISKEIRFPTCPVSNFAFSTDSNTPNSSTMRQ